MVKLVSIVALCLIPSGCTALSGFDDFTFDENDSAYELSDGGLERDGETVETPDEKPWQDAADAQPDASMEPIDGGVDAAEDSAAPESDAEVPGVDGGDCCGLGCPGCEDGFRWKLTDTVWACERAYEIFHHSCQ